MQDTASTTPAGAARPDQLVPCPNCGGQGEFLEPRSTFDARQEQWFPHEVEVPCDRCEGLGYLDLDDPRRFQEPHRPETEPRPARGAMHDAAPPPDEPPPTRAADERRVQNTDRSVRRRSMTEFQIKKATKSSAKLRMAIFGPSGSGKTMSSLRIAHGLEGRIGVIDTERGSASKYSDRWPFDVIELSEPSIENYTRAMAVFADAGYDVLIVDSISHAWEWLLDYVEKLGRTKYKGNKWSAWSEATPMQQTLVDAILQYPGHVIATMRSKTEWVTEQNDRGKSQPRRVGIAPRQRDGVEYEFDLLLEMDAEANTGRIIKDRTGRFQDRIVEKPDEELGRELAAWLADGDAPAPTAETEFPPELPDQVLNGKKASRTAKKTLTDEQAARLASSLTGLGVAVVDQLAFASAVVGREVAALSDLTVNESKRVHAHASEHRKEAA